MYSKINRRDVGYTIISRFEQCLRDFLSNRLAVSHNHFLKGIPLGIVDKAKSRSNKTEWEDSLDFLEHLDFPDLKEISCYQNSYSTIFPSSTINKELFITLMDELYILRCKIAHIKGYFTSLDLDSVLDKTELISNSNLEQFGKEYNNFISLLKNNPDELVIKMPTEFCVEVEQVLLPNNVPIPDYEYEGGFVGREEYVKKLTSELLGERHSVITISGAGGVGKTALALKIIQTLLISGKHNFDGIVWLSAKENMLSYLGIEDIEPTVKNYEQLLDTILSVMGFESYDELIEQKEQDIETLFELFGCILIVIDNLETITDERIFNFILDAHPKTKCLITSRKGLGQVERRFELKQLKEKEAVHLFRLIAKDKNIDSLVSLDDEILNQYVKKVSCYPLAIKWVIGNVAMGKDINEIIDSINETTSDISNFCFDQIYNDLNANTKRILCTLSFFDEPTSAGVLKYVVNLEQNEFDDGISDLILVSLVIPEQYKDEQNGITRKFGLLPLTRGYIRLQVDKDSKLKRDLEDRLRTVQNTIEEFDRAKKQYRFSLANMGATSEEEKVATMLAQTAFQKHQAGRYMEAVEDYKRAINIAPRFSSLYRNWAVMESLEGHQIEADKLMEKASKLSPNDEQIWLTWGNIKRKTDKIKEAHDKYQKALELCPDDYVILNALGQTYCRLGEYEKADSLFRQALQKENQDSSLRHEIINRTSLADNLARWAESLINDRNNSLAELKLHEALDEIKKVIQLDKNDSKSKDIQRNILSNLGHFYKRSNPLEAASYFEQVIVTNPIRFTEILNTIKASYHAAKIFCEIGEMDRARKILTPKLLRFREPFKQNPDLHRKIINLLEEFDITRLNGKIIRVNAEKRYTIIESLSSPGNTFLGFFNNFNPNLKSDSLENHDKLIVSFIPTEEKSELGLKKIAKFIKIS